MQDLVTVAFVDDHPVLLEGISALFCKSKRFSVVGKGDNAEDALTIFRDKQPDLIFLDLSMPGDVFAVIREIAFAGRRTRCLVYTAYANIEAALQALDNGARAFVVKDSVSDELFEACDAVMRGETFISRRQAVAILNGLRERTARASVDRAARLSTREQQVVNLLLEARSNKEIANTLAISEKTVKHYMTSLMSKFHARNRTEVALAVRDQSARV